MIGTQIICLSLVACSCFCSWPLDFIVTKTLILRAKTNKGLEQKKQKNSLLGCACTLYYEGKKVKKFGSDSSKALCQAYNA